jgi:hypothetical protein
MRSKGRIAMGRAWIWLISLDFGRCGKIVDVYQGARETKKGGMKGRDCRKLEGGYGQQIFFSRSASIDKILYYCR